MVANLATMTCISSNVGHQTAPPTLIRNLSKVTTVKFQQGLGPKDVHMGPIKPLFAVVCWEETGGRQGSVSEWEIYDTSALSFTCPPPRVIYWILLIVSLYFINSYIISWLHLWQLIITISTFLWLIDNECNVSSKVKLERFNIHLKRYFSGSLQVYNQNTNEVKMETHPQKQDITLDHQHKCGMSPWIIGENNA